MFWLKNTERYLRNLWSPPTGKYRKFVRRLEGHLRDWILAFSLLPATLRQIPARSKKLQNSYRIFPRASSFLVAALAGTITLSEILVYIPVPQTVTDPEIQSSTFIVAKVETFADLNVLELDIHVVYHVTCYRKTFKSKREKLVAWFYLNIILISIAKIISFLIKITFTNRNKNCVIIRLFYCFVGITFTSYKSLLSHRSHLTSFFAREKGRREIKYRPRARALWSAAARVVT